MLLVPQSGTLGGSSTCAWCLTKSLWGGAELRSHNGFRRRDWALPKQAAICCIVPHLRWLKTGTIPSSYRPKSIFDDQCSDFDSLGLHMGTSGIAHLANPSSSRRQVILVLSLRGLKYDWCFHWDVMTGANIRTQHNSRGDRF